MTLKGCVRCDEETLARAENYLKICHEQTNCELKYQKAMLSGRDGVHIE